jgi:hypothetical protein
VSRKIWQPWLQVTGNSLGGKVNIFYDEQFNFFCKLLEKIIDTKTIAAGFPGTDVTNDSKNIFAKKNCEKIGVLDS